MDGGMRKSRRGFFLFILMTVWIARAGLSQTRPASDPKPQLPNPVLPNPVMPNPQMPPVTPFPSTQFPPGYGAREGSAPAVGPQWGPDRATDVLKQYPQGKLTTRPVEVERQTRPSLGRANGQTYRDTTTLPWLVWWETHSDLYLNDPKSKLAVPAPKKEVIDALIKLSRSADAQVRAETALAMARMNRPQFEDAILTLAKDKVELVKLNAAAAMAMLDSARVREFVSKPPATNSRDRIAWLLVIGLMKEPPGDIWNDVLKTLGDASAPREARRLAVWAIRTQKPPIARAVLDLIIDRATELDLLNEALIGIGENPSPEDLNLLIDIAGWNGTVWDIAAIQAAGKPLSGANTNLTGAQRLAQQAAKKGVAVPQSWRYVPPKSTFTSNVKFTTVRDTAQRILAVHYAASDRAREAIGRPLYPPTVQADVYIRSTDSTLKFVESTVPWETWEVGNRLIWTGLIGDIDYVQAAVNQVDLNPNIESDDPRVIADAAARMIHSPLRGHAAISLGLYVRKTSPAGDDAPNKISDITRKPAPSASDSLTQRLRVATEPTDLRAAVALAMGLSKNPMNKDRLKQVLDDPQQNPSDVTRGFAILGLALLNDRDALRYAARDFPPADSNIYAVDLAKQFRNRPTKTIPYPTIAALRAMVEAMESLKDPAAALMLVNHWGYDPNLNLSIAKAVASLRSTNDPSADPMINTFADALLILANPADKTAPNLSAIASLGILNDTQTRSRLSPVVSTGTTVPDELEKIGFSAKYHVAPSARGAGGNEPPR